MDRERLKQIIIEEIVRALGERKDVALNFKQPASEPLKGSASFAGDNAKPGVVIFSGSKPPTPLVMEALAGLTVYGFSAEILLSFSMRQALQGSPSTSLAGLPVISEPDNEPAMERKIASSRWIVVADASLNTLNKVHLGIEDSAPSRAIAQAMRLGLGCVFLESAIAPLRGPESKRAELIRKFEPRGALRATPEELPAALHQATLPPDEKLFKPPAPKPEVRHRIITREDVYDAAVRGVTEFVVPAGSIITAEAIEDAARRGLAIRREDA